ncbi:hypothetical protein PNEG_01939 [Pneumocystis murina B123]|uniref:NADH-ubiquinone oxidoreductase n=1 Tax=Pneumocystis murina (strain B123) TaxID=1069680 RepID=M7PH38_PNEMU|nr:hypothetical protein PNEG_01939 [Pneumocystis murina B123]EMR09754.1 hypothetical protein PNEG_01939 [Pneumocystis murina B123]
MDPKKTVLNGDVLKNNTTFPEEIPHVDEVGATSAPLKAASYFIGARCKAFNEDYMLCKAENRRKLEEPCLKEGFRVTRCAISVLEDLHTYCSDQFKKYWKCLDSHNHEFRSCRSQEMEFNKCVFDNLKLEKVIPGVPEGEEPIFLKKKPIF